MVFDWNSQDGIATGPLDVAGTVTARADGSPMLDRGHNAISQKGREDEQ